MKFIPVETLEQVVEVAMAHETHETAAAASMERPN
jgi:hypothetical protein